MIIEFNIRVKDKMKHNLIWFIANYLRKINGSYFFLTIHI